MRILYLFCFSCVISLANFDTLAKDKIVLWKRNYDKPSLYAIVNLAAKLSEPEYGEYEIVPSTDLVQGRAFVSLPEGQLLNVVIGAISSDRERLGLPIYIPLDRGILGLRVCLQNASGNDLTNIKDIQDLKQQRITIGIGSHWPDRGILERNGINVAHSPVYEQLFNMLNMGRFDCFLRSLNEVQGEVKLFSNFNLKIEPSLGIVYPQADFAFVSVKHPRIHQRLTLGLHKALENGAFQEHFEHFYGGILKDMALYERKLLILENTDLSIEARDAINEYGLVSFAAHSY